MRRYICRFCAVDTKRRYGKINEDKDRWEKGDEPKDDSRPVVPFTIPFDILEENAFF
jgi:hypothetical protein